MQVKLQIEINNNNNNNGIDNDTIANTHISIKIYRISLSKSVIAKPKLIKPNNGKH